MISEGWLVMAEMDAENSRHLFTGINYISKHNLNKRCYKNAAI